MKQKEYDYEYDIEYKMRVSAELANVYYTGSSNEWELISINKDKNQVLCNLTVTFNYIVE